MRIALQVLVFLRAAGLEPLVHVYKECSDYVNVGSRP